MNEPGVPQNLAEYLYRKLASLHSSARLVFVFDPPGRLALGTSLTVAGRTWVVHRYEGNDLALRARLALGKRTLLWVTSPPSFQSLDKPRLDISSLVDLLVNAEAWFDLSICGVLQDLIPGETWPPEAVNRHADILAANLPAIVEGHAELRRYLERGAALDSHALRALVLHARQSNIPIRDFLFHKDTPAQVLDRYIRLAWGAAWDPADRELLREHARLSPQVALADVIAWFEVPPDALVGYLYLRRLLKQGRVPNIANQLRGLGALGFDPEPLEPWVDHVLARWEKETAWRQRVIVRAEESLSQSDLRRAVALFPVKDVPDLLSLLARAETPAAIYELAVRLFTSLPKENLEGVMSAWPAHRPSALGDMPVTHYTLPAQAIVGFLDETAMVLDRLAHPFVPPPGLAGILDWYVDGGYYDLEFACARAAGHLRRLPDHDLAARLQTYRDGLRKHVRDFLHKADEELAQRIREDWSGYLAHPHLSAHVLRDLVKRRRLQPKPESSLWVIIFDGMRWDSWERVIKPYLLQFFEFSEHEKAYLSLLPTWTFVARTSVLAGQPPVGWKSPDGTFTTNQKLLVGRLFGIPSGEVDKQLQFFSGMEADRTYSKLDRDTRYPWNVLIFNISDDNLHQERDNLESLNINLEARMASILQTMVTLVRPEDTMILTSDHGFMELDEEDGVVVEEDARWEREARGDANPVRFRYLLGMEHPAGYSFTHPRLRESPFTVAVGRRWFRRAGERRAPDRYAHGGLSLAEMAVPGAVLRRIVEKRVEIVFVQVPSALQVDEGQAMPVEIVVGNNGNQFAEFHFAAKADTDTAPQQFQATLGPGQHCTLQPSLYPIYREKGGSTSHLVLELGYQDARGVRQTRRQEVTVTVRVRTDVVEIEFGGLDELDRLG